MKRYTPKDYHKLPIFIDPSACKQNKIRLGITPRNISAPLACIEMNLTFYDVLKLKRRLNLKSVLITATVRSLFLKQVLKLYGNINS